MTLHLISNQYYKEYLKQSACDWEKIIIAINQRVNLTSEDFNYYLITASFFSSKIEGNTLDLNSFMREHTVDKPTKSKQAEEIEALMAAYQFAAENPLTYNNFLYTHSILSATLLPEKERGVLRTTKVGVFDNTTGKPVYLAVEPEFVENELKKLFEDVEQLISQQLSVAESFYYASMLHLWAAMIHPFGDGNGRCARLLEKWFLAAKLGISAWNINSEKMYWEKRESYYTNISLGYNYYALHWDRCLPFLKMLPEAVI